MKKNVTESARDLSRKKSTNPKRQIPKTLENAKSLKQMMAESGALTVKGFQIDLERPEDFSDNNTAHFQSKQSGSIFSNLQGGSLNKTGMLQRRRSSSGELMLDEDEEIKSN